MRINFISSLKGPNHYGGAFLRNQAIKIIYKKLGWEIAETFIGEIETKYDLEAIKNILKYGRNTSVLFKKAVLQLPEANLNHYDNLRLFQWNIFPQKPIIYNAHNIEAENFFSKKISGKAKKFLNYELEKVKQSQLTFVCSQREKNVFLQHNNSLENKIFVLPNLIETNLYQPSTDKKYILFAGSLNYFPNIKAVEFILENCNSFSSKRFQLLIAGSGASTQLKNAIREKRILFKENLDNNEMRKLFSQGHILLVPLLHGSGTRLKIIEAISSGSYVLSTPLGSEGIQHKNIINSPIESFVDTFRRCIDQLPSIPFNDVEENRKIFDVYHWYEKNGEELKKKIL